MWKPKKAEPIKVRTPLPSQVEAEKAAALEAKATSEFLRAENEDDDGYDPYSDRREETPFFESNPWD